MVRGVKMITQERIKELLSYDPKTGVFINLTQRANNIKIGSIAGNKRSDGYIQIQLDKKSYRAHQLAWLYVYGELPEKSLDHINEKKDDNRVSNLRLAIEQENPHNQSSPQTNNTSGFRGVNWHKRDKKWRAQIKLKGKKICLGNFNTPEEAYEAYLRAKRELHPFWVEKKEVA